MQRLYGSVAAKHEKENAREKRARSRRARSATPSRGGTSAADRLYAQGRETLREKARLEAEKEHAEEMAAEEQSRLNDRYKQPTVAGRKLRQKAVAERRRRQREQRDLQRSPPTGPEEESRPVPTTPQPQPEPEPEPEPQPSDE